MDVTCERCSTAYEFDDALVSERGTTVKCTNCGHQFKVRRPQALGAPERWLVRTIDGRELEFRALRELQAAIAQAVITRDDVLSRGGSRPRRLGSIAELEPFFASAGGGGGAHATSLGLGPRAPVITGYEGSAGALDRRGADPAGLEPMVGARSRASTVQGLGVAPPARTSEVSVAIPLPRGPADAPLPPPRRPPSVPPRRSTPVPPSGPLPGVIVGPGGAPPVRPGPPSAGEAASSPQALFEDATRAEPRTARASTGDDLSAPTAPFHIGQVLDPVKVRALAHEDWSAPVAPAPAANGGAPRDRSPAPAHAVDDGDLAQNQHTASVPPLTPTPGMVRTPDVEDDLLEPRFSQAASPRRSGAARWIVASVCVGMAALAFATVGRKMLVPDGSARGGQADARIGALLDEGEKSLVDGDLELAKEQFDKASVLVDRDARTAADLARLAAAKADVDWLRARLLAPDDPELPTVRRELEQAVQRAQKAADRAGALAPADPAVVRSRVDALRLAGDLAGARRLVGGISAASAQPDNALTLAELDLGESRPDWPTVLGRLRAALATDGNLGRARSMLVYALARSGDPGAARVELDHLGALPRPHPLLGALRAFVNRASPTLDPNALPDASVKPTTGKPASSTGPSAPVAREPREPREAREPHEPREPRERPAPVEPRAPSPPPEQPAAPTGPIDTSDLPGVKAPSAPPSPAPASPPSLPSPAPPRPTAAPAPPPSPAAPPGVDTSDLPGFK